MTKLGASILRGMKQALAHAEGTADKSQYVEHLPAELEKWRKDKQQKAIARPRKPRQE
jgi:hypothetical protein